MNSRIKELRIALGENQTEFAKKLAVSRSAICKIESGENSPSEQTIALICKNFSVNEYWLRTGTGEMFVKRTRDQQMSDAFAEIQKLGSEDFKNRLIAALLKLDDDGWNKIEDFVDSICKK